ncbi:MAG: BNR-4 repeat-containing protein, partial [Planctomycetota bacterium]
MLDAAGHVWVFSSAHGTARPAHISVSTRPYDVSEFELVRTHNYSYPQPWYLDGKGFLFLHTKYGGGRRLYQSTSPDGRTWTDRQLLAGIDQGHYQISRARGDKVATAFNYHPKPRGLNWRTNLYYMETSDFGRTWRTAAGQPVDLPLTEPDNAALVHDYAAEKLNVYMKDLALDADGRPVILFLTSGGWQSGPDNDPRTWRTARWTGRTWEIRGQITSDNNYDMGSLYIEGPDLWRLIGPTEPGPQRYNTGGEVALWTSADQGASWSRVKQLTRNSPRNHTYCRRPVHARPDFYALWADGHGRQPSESRLYFCTRDGDVFLLPPEMTTDTAKPIPVKQDDF